VEANEHEPSQCSRVAYGLAKLPLYPTLFEHAQRIDDYALLHTILSVVPDAPFTVDELMDALAQRNVEGDRHRTRVLQLLHGDLPPGIQSNAETDNWLTRASQSRLLPASMSVFEQPDPQVFQMNLQAKALIQHRLEIFERNLHRRYSDIILSHHSSRSVSA
ncbi:MAG: hypothetical protein VKL39_01960, partial [Leptolyngbyaceae bacterium]|nr:hypothetical protein [Leptolyngbyaceae bacterium]